MDDRQFPRRARRRLLRARRRARRPHRRLRRADAGARRGADPQPVGGAGRAPRRARPRAAAPLRRRCAAAAAPSRSSSRSARRTSRRSACTRPRDSRRSRAAPTTTRASRPMRRARTRSSCGARSAPALTGAATVEPMPTRDDILTELGLVPTWRLRARAGAGGAPRPCRACCRRASGAPAAAVVPRRRRAGGRRGARRAHRQRSSGATSPRTSTPAPPAAWRAPGRSRCPASATSAPSGCSSARRPGAEEDAKGEPFVGQAGQAARQHAGGAGHEARRERLHRQRAQVPAAEQPHAGAARGRRLPALSRPADRADRGRS